MAYKLYVEFIETPVFTRRLLELMDDDEYRELQTLLIAQPDVGDIIRGGGGIRKVRFGLGGRGKSGGIRTICFWKRTASQIYMLLIYPKSEKDTLSAEETEILRSLVKEL